MTGAETLRDRSAFVTGGSRGIGLAIARRFAAAGAQVAICGRDLNRLTAAAEEIRRETGAQVIAHACDVRRPEEVRALASALRSTMGSIHILVNNAGISGMTPLLGLDSPDSAGDERWHDILATNLDGVYYVTKAILPLMPSPGGRIINLSSVLGRFGVPGYAAYCTTKHGLIGFTRALAMELAERGITVNALCPGWVATDMAWQGIRESAAARGMSSEAFREQAMAGVPIGRMIEPGEVAELSLYLASDAAAGITGQAINLCGGQTMD
jgi:ketoreductase